jgi:hypothetical protein
MRWTLRCSAALALALATAACGASRARGATTPDELAQRFHEGLNRRSRPDIESLIFWPDGQKHESPTLDYFLKAQATRTVHSVTVVAVPDDQMLEYTRGGIRYTPSLTPLHKLLVTFTARGGGPSDESAGFLVGAKDGRYYVTLAAPAASTD